MAKEVINNRIDKSFQAVEKGHLYLAYKKANQSIYVVYGLFDSR